MVDLFECVCVCVCERERERERRESKLEREIMFLRSFTCLRWSKNEFVIKIKRNSLAFKKVKWNRPN